MCPQWAFTEVVKMRSLGRPQPYMTVVLLRTGERPQEGVARRWWRQRLESHVYKQRSTKGHWPCQNLEEIRQDSPPHISERELYLVCPSDEQKGKAIKLLASLLSVRTLMLLF